MNIRKKVDYSEMYAALDHILAIQIPQMELYSEIGKVVCRRTEKGAAVAVAAYLSEHYPDVKGFSPRNIRRMRDFYRTYENQPALLSLAMKIGWTQNVVILEADLSMEQRMWYIRAVRQFEWSRAQLIEKIAANVHEMMMLTIDEEICNTVESEDIKQKKSGNTCQKKKGMLYLIRIIKCLIELRRKIRRRLLIILCLIYTEKQLRNCKLNDTRCILYNKRTIWD